MTDKNAIKVISGLLQQASPATEQAVNDIISKYPYFVPARYIKAAQDHHKKAFSADMLTSVYPYTGNWLLFLDHLQGVRKPAAIEDVHKVVETPAPAVVEEVIATAMPVAAPEIATEPEMPETVAEEVEYEDVTMHELEVAEEQAEPIDIEEELHVTDIINATEDDTVNEQVQFAGVEEAQQLIPEITYEPAVTAAEEETLATMKTEEDIFTPFQSDDYFMQQGIKISRDLPEHIDEFVVSHEEDTTDKALMVMMNFTEWLLHFKNSAAKKNSEIEDQRAIRTMWQKEKLAAAMEEENEEIPENVFEMAVNSIAKEEGLASESLAEIYLKQGKHEQAVEMYKKLSLRNPQKNAYFARKIEEILKDKPL